MNEFRELAIAFLLCQGTTFSRAVMPHEFLGASAPGCHHEAKDMLFPVVVPSADKSRFLASLVMTNSKSKTHNTPGLKPQFYCASFGTTKVMP